MEVAPSVKVIFSETVELCPGQPGTGAQKKWIHASAVAYDSNIEWCYEHYICCVWVCTIGDQSSQALGVQVPGSDVYFFRCSVGIRCVVHWLLAAPIFFLGKTRFVTACAAPGPGRERERYEGPRDVIA